jgi:hypothetical protein
VGLAAVSFMAALYMGWPVAWREPGNLGRIDTGFGEAAPPFNSGNRKWEMGLRRYRFGRGGIILRGDACPRSAEDHESALTVHAEAVDGEVIVEARGETDSDAFHERETGAIHDGKLLIRILLTDLPGAIEIFHSHSLDKSGATSNAIPEPLRVKLTVSCVQKQPRFDQTMVGYHMVICAAQDLLGATIVSVLGYDCGKPDRRVNKNCQIYLFLAREAGRFD